MPDLLVSVESFKAWMRSEIQTDDDPHCADALATAQQTFSNACQRQFAAVAVGATATARTFRVSGVSNVLFIHDCTSITSVVENGTTLTAGTDYQAEPLNNLSSAGEAWPYYRLIKPYSAWYSYGFATVVVTAKWGWPATPAPVLSAIRIIAKDEFNQRSTSGFGLVTVTEAGGVGTRENRIVQQAVRDYAHPNAIGVA